MNISTWSIKRPIPVILFFIILTVTGIFSFKNLGIDYDPNVDFPMIIVNVTQPGASPKEIEMEVTKKIEDSLVGLGGLEHITSTVRDSVSVTNVEFKVGWPTDTALNDVRGAIAKIRQELPQDINEPTVIHPTTSGTPFIVYSVESDKRSVAELSYFVDDTIERNLLTVPGVSKITRAGGVVREIRINLNPESLKALNITAAQVNDQIKGLNLNISGGESETAGLNQSIRAEGSSKSIEDLKNLEIVLPNGQTTRLDTIGKVIDSTSEIKQIARLDGRMIVSFSVTKAQGFSMVGTEEKVKKKIEELNKTIPQDIKIKMVRTSANFVRDTYQASNDALFLGAFLAIVVIFAFLRNWQATFIGALAIPLSLFGTYIFMYAEDYSMNRLTTLGLTLVVGILVDDAIVDLENIYRHIGMGKKPIQAAKDATDEIGLAVVATTLAIVAVFLPLAFLGGVPGQFFRPFGLTVAVSVMFSLLVARVLTPMMGAYLLPANVKEEEHKEGKLQRIHKSVLVWSLDHRLITSIMALLLFIGSIALVPLLPKSFLSNGDTSEATLSVALPKGSTIEDTDKTVEQIRNILQKRKDVKLVYSTIGVSEDVNQASIFIELVQPKERKLSLEEFEYDLLPSLESVAGARITYDHLSQDGVNKKPLNVVLTSSDRESLSKTSEQLLKEMRDVPEFRDVTSSESESKPELVIKPNFKRAAEQGISLLNIARTARVATQAETEINMAKFNLEDRQIKIRVKVEKNYLKDIDAINYLMVYGKNGSVPLKSVADIYVSSGPTQINRYDRTRQITISANLNNISLGEGTDIIDKLPVIKNLPPDIQRLSIGEAKVMADVFGSFTIAIVAGIFMVYSVLVILFGSFLHPLTIMVALPLSTGGAIAGLLIGNKPMGLMALIGILMLMGIVTKNSILLVEYALMSEKQGMNRREAIIHSGLSRLRPIIMTTIAMLTGTLPIAMSIGAGTETQSPLAVAVIGGLMTSTVFSLVVVPAIYTYVGDFKEFMGKFIKFANREDEIIEVTEEEKEKVSVT